LKEKSLTFSKRKTENKKAFVSSEGVQINKGGAIAEFILPLFVCQPAAYLRWSFFGLW
jgi:hypothetical protein